MKNYWLGNWGKKQEEARKVRKRLKHEEMVGGNHIYGFKSPSKHMVKMTDGEYESSSEEEIKKGWARSMEPFDFSAGLYNEDEPVCITVTVDMGRQETYINGELSDVKVFNRGLTEEEIQDLYYPGYPHDDMRHLQQTIDPIRDIIEEEDRRFLQAVWDAIHVEGGHDDIC